MELQMSGTILGQESSGSSSNSNNYNNNNYNSNYNSNNNNFNNINNSGRNKGGGKGKGGRGRGGGGGGGGGGNLNNKGLDLESLVVIYNRIPKTGSTSFIGLAYDLCSRNKFSVINVNTTKKNPTLSLTDQVSRLGCQVYRLLFYP